MDLTAFPYGSPTVFSINLPGYYLSAAFPTDPQQRFLRIFGSRFVYGSLTVSRMDPQEFFVCLPSIFRMDPREELWPLALRIPNSFPHGAPSSFFYRSPAICPADPSLSSCRF